MKKEKIMAAIATTVMTFSLISIGTTVYATPEIMSDGTVFDAEYYAKNNPDVVAVCGVGKKALFQHYVTYGNAEGRKASAFDAEYYAKNNPDVLEVYGSKASALYQHYLAYGQAEGRKANAEGEPVENYASDEEWTSEEEQASLEAERKRNEQYWEQQKVQETQNTKNQIIGTGSVKEGIELSEEEFAEIARQLSNIFYDKSSNWIVVEKHQISPSDSATVVIESDDPMAGAFDGKIRISYNIKQINWCNSISEEELQKERDRGMLGGIYVVGFGVRLQEFEWYNALSEEEQLKEVLTDWGRLNNYIPEPWETEEEWRQRLKGHGYDWYSDEYALDYEEIFKREQEELTKFWGTTDYRKW